MAKKTKLQLAQEKAEAAIKITNERITELGINAGSLYGKLNAIQAQFDAIRNVPSEKRIRYEQLSEICLEWKHQAEAIETDFKAAVVKNTGGGAVGASAGVAVAAFGPTAAMGVATTFGVASTGTAISTLSGAAATNAALAWLGGGAIAAGGGGIAAGEAMLALAGPVGWALAGVALLGSGLFMWKAKNDRDRLEKVFTLISKRDTKSYNLATIELNERIFRMQREGDLLDLAINKIQFFGTDYDLMTETQQYELGAYVNLMEAATQLLINPILGLLPKYTETDFDSFLIILDSTSLNYCRVFKNVIITLANMLYKIDLDETDRKLLIKCLRKNKEFLASMSIDKKLFNDLVFFYVDKCLKWKYMHYKQ